MVFRCMASVDRGGMLHRLRPTSTGPVRVTKPFIVNPWMLDQADRLIAHALSNGLLVPTPSEWGFLEGFRRADQDVDRLPGNWLEGWHALSRASLDRAKALRKDRKGLPAVCFSSMPQAPVVSMHAFQSDPLSGGISKKLASALIDARSDGLQGWISLPAGTLPSTAAIEGSLRLGAAWWCEPPEEKMAWEAFCQSHAAWGEFVLRSPDWDQWVWPWSCMIEQGLMLCLHGKRPMASRMSAPPGWKDRRAAAWGGLGMRAWQSAVDISEGGWEDLWIGLLCDRLFRNAPSCD